jgi:hypothetical protein
MANPEQLKVTVDTTTVVNKNAPILERDAFLVDIQKRLDSKKALLIKDATKLIDNDLSDFFEQVNQQVMKDVGLQVLEWDVKDTDGKYMLYYTDLSGKQRKLDEEIQWKEAVKDTAFVKGMFDAVLSWMLDTKIQTLVDLKKQWKITDKTKLAAITTEIDNYNTDIKKTQDEFVKKYSNEVIDNVQPKIAKLQQEILSQIPDVTIILNEVASFSWNQSAMSALDQKISSAIIARDQIRAIDPTKSKQYNNEIIQLVDAQRTLRIQYINGYYAKNIQGKTPSEDKDPTVLSDLKYVLWLVDSELLNINLTAEERQALEKKKLDIQNIKRHFEVSAEDNEAKRLFERYKKSYESLSSWLDMLTAEQLKARIDEHAKQRTELLDAHNVYDAKRWATIEPLSTEIADIKAKFEELKTILPLFKDYADTSNVLSSLYLKRKQLLESVPLKKNGEPKKKDDRDTLKGIDDSILTTKQAIEQKIQLIQHKTKSTALSLTTLPVDNTKWETTKNAPSTTPALQNAVVDGFDDIPEPEKKVLTEKFFWQSSALLEKGDWWKMRSLCNPRHQEYLIAYQKIALKDFMGDSSRANSLKNLVKENTKFDDKELWSVRDFRLLAKNLKNQRDEAKDKYKYAKKAIWCLFEWSYYNAFNKQSLQMIESLEANKLWLSAMQPAPTFACGCEETMLQVMAPGWMLACCGQELLRGIPWINPQAEMIKILSECDVYKKMMKNIDASKWARCTPEVKNAHPYFFPHELPGTSAHDVSSSTNGVLIYDIETKTYKLEWEMSPNTLLTAYIASHTWQNLQPDHELKNQSNNDTHYAHLLLKNRFKWTWWFDLIGEMGKFNTPKLDVDQRLEMISQMFKDALVHDDRAINLIRKSYTNQLNNYWYSRERNAKHDILNQDVKNIPADEKERMLSRAAAEWYAYHYGMPENQATIEWRLQELFGGSRQEKKFVHNSDRIVWQNMSRIIDEHRGEPWYALSALSLKDFNSVDKVYDEVKAHGVFGTLGNAITAGLQNIPGMTASMANDIGNITWSLAKWWAIIFAVKAAWEWVSEKWFSIKSLWRGMMLGWWLMLVGKDLHALAFGWEWWVGMRIINAYQEKKDLFNDKEWLGPTQWLSLIFGDMPVSEFMKNIQVNKEWKFELNPGSYSALMNNPNATSAQKELLSAMFQWSDGSVNQMIDQALTEQLGVDTQNYPANLAPFWSMKLADFIRNKTITSNYEAQIQNALGGMDAATKKEIEDHLHTLTNPQDKENFLKKIDEMATFGKKRNDLEMMFGGYFPKRPDIAIDPVMDAALKWWFANKADIALARKQFLLWVGPNFTPTSTADDLRTYLVTTYFAWNGDVAKLLQSSDVNAEIKKLYPGAIVDFAKDNKRHINNPASGAWAQYSEMCFENIGWKTGLTFIGIEKTSLWSSKLVLWVQNTNWVYEQWQVDTIWTPPVNLSVDHIGFDGTTFVIGDGSTQKNRYVSKMLDTIVTTIANNPTTTWGELSAVDYNTIPVPVPPSKTPFTLSKTANTRP